MKWLNNEIIVNLLAGDPTRPRGTINLTKSFASSDSNNTEMLESVQLVCDGLNSTAYSHSFVTLVGFYLTEINFLKMWFIPLLGKVNILLRHYVRLFIPVDDKSY